EPLREFSLTLLIGFSLGAYSSIFVAPPLLALWHQAESKK
ncbi:MAG: protein translocase subunit SecF, partial [Candidatus Margulisbacteria bacterium]|nr:protein translocase subunit SecF [Candidatus Margulisiibacteriota bacterium]